MDLDLRAAEDRTTASGEAGGTGPAAAASTAASRPDGFRPVDTDAVIRLAELGLLFARVDRVTFHPDGVTPESDTDHTVMLSLVACAFAAQYLPQLDLGRVAQYALVHDLVEAYAGDTPTLRIDAQQQTAKKEREAAALRRLEREFAGSFPWLTDLLTAYEAQEADEARYVRAMDKLVPKITHLLNAGATMRAQGLGVAEVSARYHDQLAELRDYAEEFLPMFGLRAELVDRLLGVLAENEEPF